MRKAFKIILYIICFLLLLVLGGVVYLNTPSGQNFVRGRAEAYLRNKLKTEVSIGHLGYGLPKYIVLNNVLFLDQAKDTLLSAGELKIDINMLQLLHKEVSVQQILLKSVHSHIYRNSPDTTFNFTYIINAFTGTPSNTAKPKDTTSSSLKIDLDRVKLDDIHFRFDDYTGGVQFAVNLDHLDLQMKKVDIDKMSFHIKDLSVAGIQSTFRQDTSYLRIRPKDTTKAKLQLVADNVNLQRISFQYTDNLNKLLYGTNVGALQLQLNIFSLEDNVVDVKKLVIDNTNSVLTIGRSSTPPAIVDTIIKIDTTEGWNVNAGDVALGNVDFKMDYGTDARQPAGVDYYHLNVRDIGMSMKNLHYSTDSISGNLKHFTLKEQSGLIVKELRTAFNYNQHGTTLKNLYLQTPVTVLQDHLEVHYPSIAEMQKHMQSLALNLHVSNSVIGLSDVLLFAPQLEKQDLFRKFKNDKIRVEASVTGLLNNLNIAHFYAAGLSNTEILLNGRLSGIPDTKAIGYNLNITKFQSSRKDIAALVPDTLLSSVRLPDQFGITGQVAGTINDYKAELYLISTDGLAHVKGSVATSAGKNKETYDVEFSTSALNVGRIIKQDSLMGSVTMSATAKGQSFDVKTMIASVNAKVSSAFIKGYRYHDIKLSAKVAGQKGDLDFISVDSNLQMQLTGHADFSGKYASAKADIKLDSIDFRALKLYSSELRASGVIHFDFPELNPDYPRGELKWWDPIITASGNRYYLDSLYIKSSPDAQNSQNIVVNLDVVQGTISGKTPLTKIVPIIEEHINRHYKFHSLDSTKNSKDAIRQLAIDTTQLPANYDLKILAHVIDKPMLHSILPGLTSFDSIHVDAALTPQYLVLNVNAPDIEYSGYSIKNCNVNVNGADSAFTYKITADKVSQGNNMTLWYADIHGNLDKNKITSTVSLCDDARKERFLLTASIEQTGDTDVIQLLPGLKLNYNVWNVAQPNRIVLANGGVYVQNFSIDNSGQYIKANSSEARINTPLKIDVTNFLLSNITESFSHNDTLLVGGILGGVITIDQMKPALKVTSDLQILQLSILGDTLGDLQATVNNKDENVLDTKVILKGEGNDIALTGSYYLQQNNGNDFNFDLNVNALALHSFETIAQNQIRRSSGYLRGKLAVKGTPSAPVIIGELTTDNLVTTVSQLNSSFRMPSEKIEFTSDGITLNNFVIHDSSDNKAVFNGTINTTDLADIQLDMKVDAQNWRVLHSTKKDNSVLFGDLLVTANLAVNGSATSPSVEGDINVLKGTNVTVVIPQPTPQMQDTKGIVVFVNMKDTGRRNVLVPEKKKPVKRKISVGSDFNVNLSVNKAAQFSLILDESSGDFLAVKGDAAINASVTAGGVISLTGTYALVGGTYQFHYNFIKRKFDIKDGSTIIFTGDPINGTTLDVTAAYVANVPSYDLVQREVTDPTQLNYYKQRLPFDVDLYMKGPVLTPQLTFNVELPDNKVYPLSTDQIQLIQAKLSQVRLDTSQLNKQVFALLILGRFVADDPFGNGVSQSATFAALQSVSTFIGEQLNNAASKLVKGVDFAVDLGTTQDYTTGNMRQRTDLNLAASKRLLNDRLKLTIGNDFELQGPQTGGSQTSLVPTDLAADYLLTSDGRYTMRAYRKTYDEGVLQGYITQTGLNFIVSLDYDNFKDAFLKKKPKKIKAKDIKAQNDSTATNK